MLAQIDHKILKSKRKTYSLSVDSFGTLIIKVPNHLSAREINRIVENHSDWIYKKINFREEVNTKNGLESLVKLQEIILIGKRKKVILDGQVQGVSLENECIKINSTFSDKLESFIKNWFKKYAKDYFTRKCSELSETSGLNFNQLKISDARKRWGSCSSYKTINLSWRLIMAEPYVIESVILHELVHTVYMNHSNKFYSLLDSLDLNRRESDLWLKENSFLLNLY